MFTAKIMDFQRSHQGWECSFPVKLVCPLSFGPDENTRARRFTAPVFAQDYM